MTVTVSRGSSARLVRKPRRRKPIKRATIWVHRWISLVLGLVLLVITTSGALIVYSPEWTVWTNGGTFSTTPTDSPISFAKAVAVVDAEHPSFEAGSVNVYHGLYEISSVDGDKHPGFYGVDPGTGTITGKVYPDHGVMAFFNQVHECFFTCDTYPGYISLLNEPVPSVGIGWPRGMTYAGVILGLAALMLGFLALSGIWLWWPTLKRWRDGFRVRFHKGRYARDYDLHQVIGMVAVPFLLMWTLTGANFEFTWVSKAWYAATGGETPKDTSFASTAVPGTSADIGLSRAIDVAQAKAGADSPLVYASSPTPGDKTATYSFYFARGFDQWGHGAYPGNYGVSVDRYDDSRTSIDDYADAPTLSNRLLDNWGAPMFHYGQSVNGWWRAIWFGFGMTPLVLAITGVSTWLAKRKVRKERKRYAPIARVDAT